MATWMPTTAGVEHVPTQAKGGAGTFKPLAVVNHIMQGYQQTMIDRAPLPPGLQNPVSYHFTIGRSGRIVQHVGIETIAWHVGRTDPGANPTWPLWEPGVSCNNRTIGIGHEGFTGDPWPDEMWDASLRVQEWIFEQLEFVPSVETIIGHYEIAPVSRAHDPGTAWDKQRVIKHLRAQGAGEILDNLGDEEAWRHFGLGLYEVLGHRSEYEEDGRTRRMIVEWNE